MPASSRNTANGGTSSNHRPARPTGGTPGRLNPAWREHHDTHPHTPAGRRADRLVHAGLSRPAGLRGIPARLPSTLRLLPQSRHDRPAPGGLTEWLEVEHFLHRRRGLLDAVVFSGGEPTRHGDLEAAIRRARGWGIASDCTPRALSPAPAAPAAPSGLGGARRERRAGGFRPHRRTPRSGRPAWPESGRAAFQRRRAGVSNHRALAGFSDRSGGAAGALAGASGCPALRAATGAHGAMPGRPLPAAGRRAPSRAELEQRLATLTPCFETLVLR